ncbi:MAG: response regulator [Deltaproteobacteria bacterium]|nr:response regulator [Deltaproteobacteria bacterium]
MNQVIQNPRRVGEPPGGVRTLIIDDDPSIVRFLEIYLENQGFTIASALTGEEGLVLARQLQPDLILLDQMMPGLDGIEVLRRLKDEAETQRIPVVILTARSDVGEKVKGLDLGVDDYITKPFDIRELKARLLSVVARRREHDENTEAERLKTLKEVVASVSHEVNNPLAAILMCAEALERRRESDPYVRDKSRVIQDNVLRIRDILQRLERVKVIASKPYVAKERILDLGPEASE